MPADSTNASRPAAAIPHTARGCNCRWNLCLLLVVAACSLAGCSRKPKVPWGTAEGKVTVAGEPVNQGTVIFDNRELGVSRMAELQTDGSFVQRSVDFPGLPVGKYRVAISPLGISKGDWAPVTKAVPGMVATPIPEQYRTVEKSDLTAEVKEGKNAPFVFDLKK
jgi:hypothetical protein